MRLRRKEKLRKKIIKNFRKTLCINLFNLYKVPKGSVEVDNMLSDAYNILMPKYSPYYFKVIK